MFSPTVRHIERKTAVDPVKCTPPRSGCERTCFVISAGSPWMKLITPSGRPASRRSSRAYQLENMEALDGFHTTVLPISAGAAGRLAAIEVKLKGVTA